MIKRASLFASLFAVLSVALATACVSEELNLTPPDEDDLVMTIDGPHGRIDMTYRLVDGYALAGGDMILATPEQRAQRGLGNRRGVKQWRNGVVPYEIDTNAIQPWQQAQIRAAMDKWEQDTEIRFVERQGEADYIEFVQNNDVCWSEIGRVGGHQKIRLRENCGVWATRHELGHAIGLLHEHQRPDRDLYIQFDPNCTDHAADFKPVSATDGEVTKYGAYDYDSIMHYGTRYNVPNDAPDDTTRRCPDLLHIDNSALVGDRELSTGDVAAVRDMYRDELRTQVGIEAESASLTWPMRTVTDASASAGRSIVVPNGAGTGGSARFSFLAPRSATYYVWGRVSAPTPDDDSFYVSVDGSARTRWNTPRGPSGTWTWGRVPIAYPLSYGTHTLVIDQREDGTRLDRVILTDDPAWQPYEAWIAGEDALFQAPMRADLFAGAIGGRAAHVPPGAGNDRGAAYYDLYVPASDRYTIHARVRSPDGGADSFYVTVDELGPVTWNTGVSTSFVWRAMAPARPSYLLRPGLRLLLIGGSEDGTSLDEILVTNDRSFAPAAAGFSPLPIGGAL